MQFEVAVFTDNVPNSGIRYLPLSDFSATPVRAGAADAHPSGSGAPYFNPRWFSIPRGARFLANPRNSENPGGQRSGAEKQIAVRVMVFKLCIRGATRRTFATDRKGARELRLASPFGFL